MTQTPRLRSHMLIPQQAEKPKPTRFFTTCSANQERTSVPPYTMATIYGGLGEKDKAFEFLEKARSQKSLDMSLFLTSDLRLDNLRTDAVSKAFFAPWL